VLRIDGKVSADGTKACKTTLKKRGHKDSVAQVLVFRPPPPRPPPPSRLLLLCMLILSRLKPLPPLLLSLLPLLLSLLPLLLSLLPLLLAAGIARAVAAERRPGPGSRLLLKLKPPRARSRTGARVRNPTTTRATALCSRSADLKKRRAAQKYVCFKSTRKSRPAPLFSCV
jgi:hypothetical protein